MIPDFVEPLDGYRWFYVMQTKGVLFLSATTACLAWEPHEPNKAKCLDLYCDDAPCSIHGGLYHSYGSGCGIYSYNSIEAALEDYRLPLSEDDYWPGRDHPERPAGLVMSLSLGRIIHWGKVYEYEKGYRSEYAQLEHLYTPPADWPNATVIRKYAETNSVLMLDGNIDPVDFYGVSEYAHAGEHGDIMLVIRRNNLFGKRL